MTSKDEIFNRLVELDIFDYELAELTHECRLCGSITDPTYRLIFDEDEEVDIDEEIPFLYICEGCHDVARRIQEEEV